MLISEHKGQHRLLPGFI